jgi:microcystin degradation protein MlrC
MTTILIAECRQEVSSFNPVPSHYTDFDVLAGDALIDYHRRVRDEVGGALSVFDLHPDLRLVPALSARAITSGGTLAAADWQRLAREWLGALRAAGPVDGAYFCLHGAMSAEGEDDPEGYLLQEARAILGERIPIVVSLDLHGVLTERMLQHSDVTVVYHTYPHIDFFSTGQRSARALLRVLSGEVRPVSALVPVPALVRGDELITETGAIRFAVQRAQAVEASPGGIAAALMWGNPFTDVPDLRTNSLVTVDGDPARAEREAIAIANLFWEQHEKMRVPLTGLADAARIALETLPASTRVKPATVVLVDAADATSSGASGDSLAIVQALLAAGYPGRTLAPVVDAPAVEAAFAAGIGARVRVSVGGSLDRGRFSPLPIEARVRLLSDGDFLSETTRSSWHAGRTAVLEAGSYTYIVTSRAVSLFDRALFYAHGCDPRAFDCVVVKSPQCEPHMFREGSTRYVDVDAPGATSANLLSLPYRRCARPIFALDPDVAFVPRAQIFQRPR